MLHSPDQWSYAHSPPLYFAQRSATNLAYIMVPFVLMLLSRYNWCHSQHLCEAVRVTHDDGVELTFDNIVNDSSLYAYIAWCAESNQIEKKSIRFGKSNRIGIFFLNWNALIPEHSTGKQNNKCCNLTNTVNMSVNSFSTCQSLCIDNENIFQVYQWQWLHKCMCNATVIWTAEIFLIESVGVRAVAVCIRPNLNHGPVLRTMLRLAERQSLYINQQQ